jgi:hypothetical protein
MQDVEPFKVRGVFSTNALWGVASGWTVTYHMMQLAYYMGIKELYLLGMDFSFQLPPKRVETGLAGGYGTSLESVGERNHFHPDYRKPGELWALPDLAMQLRAYSLAKETFESAGRKIYNASRATKLEVYPRISLEEVLGRPASAA